MLTTQRILTTIAFSMLLMPASADILSPAVRFSVHDEPPNGLGNSLNAPELSWLIRNSASLADRAMHEFDVSAYAAANLSNATLRFSLFNNNSGGTYPRVLEAVIYAGNGVADIADYQIAGTVVATVNWPTPTAPPPVSVDVTTVVSQLIDGGATHIGVRVQGISANLFASGLAEDGELELTIAPPDCNGNGIDDALDVTAGPIDFFAPWVDSVAVLPRAFERVDMNGDTIADVVTVTAQNQLAVSFGNADGTYQFPVVYDGGIVPNGLAVADFDSDGDRDVAVTTSGTNSLRLYRNTAGGLALYGSTDFFFGTNLLGVISTRLDSGATNDLVLLFATGIYAQLGTGTATGDFNATGQGIVPVPANASPVALTAADFNNDGDRDIAVVNSATDNVSVFANNGSGTFAAAVNYAVGDNPRAIAAIALNNDAFPELVVANVNTDNMTILFGNAAGAFGSPQTIPTGDQPVAVIGVNVDGDTDQDIAVGNTRDSTVSVFVNDGAANLQLFGPFAVASSINAIRVGDAEGDGDSDLHVLSLASTITTLRNLGGGSFIPGPKIFQLSNGLSGIAALDLLNNDTLPDLILTNTSTNSWQIVRNIGASQFQLVTTRATVDNPFEVHTADLDDDGDTDFITAGLDDGRVAVIENENGTFVQTYFNVTTNGLAVPVTLDLDDDGDLDIAVTETGASLGGTNYGQGRVHFLRNDGAISFTLLAPIPVGNGAVGLVAADFNRDGFDDLAVAHITSQNVQILTNAAGLGFSGPVALPSYGGNLFRIAAADLDADADVDLVVGKFEQSTTYNDGIGVYLNNGNGAFASVVRYDANSPSSVALGDLNGDGVLDIAAGCPFTDNLAVLRGNGDGTFANSPGFLLGDAAASIALADIEPDGRVDVISPAGPGGRVYLLFNNSQYPASRDCNGNVVPDECDIAFGTSTDTNANGIPDECEPSNCPGDVDGDNDVDLVDLAFLLTNFGVGSGATREMGDLDGDTDVDLIDLANLLTNFGNVCP